MADQLSDDDIFGPQPLSDEDVFGPQTGGAAKRGASPAPGGPSATQAPPGVLDRYLQGAGHQLATLPDYVGEGQQAALTSLAQRAGRLGHAKLPWEPGYLAERGQQLLDVPGAGFDALTFLAKPIFGPVAKEMSAATGGVITPEYAESTLMALGPKGGGAEPVPRVPPVPKTAEEIAAQFAGMQGETKVTVGGKTARAGAPPAEPVPTNVTPLTRNKYQVRQGERGLWEVFDPKTNEVLGANSIREAADAFAAAANKPDWLRSDTSGRPSRNVTKGVLSDADVFEIPPEAGGEETVRLYRGQAPSGPHAPIADWIREAQDASGHSAATGRWWAETPEQAEWYQKDAGPGGEIVYIDVPKSVADAARVSKNPKAASFSADPESEFFLPPEYVNKGTKYEPNAAPKMMGTAHEVSPAGVLSDEDVFGKWFGEQKPEAGAPPPTSSFAQRFGDQGAPLPESLAPEALADDLFRIRQSRPADMAEIQQALDRMPAEVKNPDTMERMFRFGEGDPNAHLTPQERAIFEQHIQPMRDELSQLYAKVYEANHGVELPGLEDVVQGQPYMHRIVKGRAPQFDELEGAATADPIYGARQLSRKPSPMQERSVFTVQNAKGTRKVVTVAPDGVYIWNRGERVKLPGVNPGDIRVGEKVPILDQDWDVTQARSQEVHEHTPIKYHRNAFANTAEALVRMRAASRAVDMLDRITQTPGWNQIARPIGAKGTPSDWRTPKLPQLKEWRMRPDVADVFDDFVGKNLSNWEEGLAKVNRFAVGSIFWNPIPHIENVATHWLVGRGWDNFMPKGLSRLAKTMPRAIEEVVTQGPKYRQMLKEGGGLIYGSVANRDFYGAMMKKLGQQIEAHPDAWTPIVKTLGFTGVPQFLRGWYRASSKALWSVGDMMMMQRYLENEAKGMSSRAAIKEAEKHIPNYRIPAKVLGSRGWSQFLQNPAFDVFSRYHYGQFKSYANILKDFYKGTPEQKLDAAGNVFTMAVLMAVAYPALDYAIQQATGSKDARKIRRGALSVPDALVQLYNGDKEFPELMGSTITMTPAVTMAGEIYKNKDFFTGQDIVNSGGDPGRGAAQIAEYLMQKMVSPYQTGVQAWKDVQGSNPANAAARVLLRQVGGYQDPSSRSLRNKRRQPMYDRKEELSRLRRPHGPIESGYEALRRKSAKPAEQNYKGPD